jgi:hypothetical protein
MMTEDNLTPCKAIHRFCIDCMGGSQKGPRMCNNSKCPLFTYRLGMNPKRKKRGKSTPSTKKRQSEKIFGVYMGKIKPLEVDVEGKKRIRLIVEDIE